MKICWASPIMLGFGSPLASSGNSLASSKDNEFRLDAKSHAQWSSWNGHSSSNGDLVTRSRLRKTARRVGRRICESTPVTFLRTLCGSSIANRTISFGCPLLSIMLFQWPYHNVILCRVSISGHFTCMGNSCERLFFYPSTIGPKACKPH
jgi:hypothetical protein